MKNKRMLAISNTLVSEELIDTKFVCDLSACKGACCVEGDSGAPLEKGEEKILKDLYTKVKKYMTQGGIATIEEKGFSVVDEDGDDTIPLVEGGKKKYCSFVHFNDKGGAECSIEKAYKKGEVDFKKPISCHLYPIRIKKLDGCDALNFSSWNVCKPAHKCGAQLNVQVFRFLKEPLTRKYGTGWYEELARAAELLHKE
jgi:hypothetical protein